MKKYIVMFGLTLALGLFVSNTVVAQIWEPNGTHIFNNNTGNIGIGDGSLFTPNNKLHILTEGEANILLQSTYTGSANRTLGAFRIFQPLPNGGNHQFFMGMRWWNGDYDLVQSVRVDGSTAPVWKEFSVYQFSTENYEIKSGVNDFVINNRGRVSMGFATPPEGDYRLAVNGGLKMDGKLTASEVEVKLDVWPDFVFHDDYELMSLYKVEQFIKTNRHLPDVPSEEKVLKNGVNVGQMTALLLQKIEELTLHVIELNKRIDELER